MEAGGNSKGWIRGGTVEGRGRAHCRAHAGMGCSGAWGRCCPEIEAENSKRLLPPC